ncbi:YkgJ family cysteine cluster protein [Aquitalea sp. S1-19]|nr:YkgJ family cysteine cluster protein [Aquitalea sp. S1-19]
MSQCQSCGACCASFRVSFYWAEASDGGGTVPAELTEELDPWRRCMRGTWSDLPLCAALQGEVGTQVSCAIYPERPSTCHDVREGDAQCLRARERWGLSVPQLMPA